MKIRISLFLIGLLMGITHFIPGVSCANVGFFSRIYRETAIVVANVREHFRISIRVLFPLLLGMLLMTLVGFFWGGNLPGHIASPLRFFFLGTVLACIPVCAKPFLKPTKSELWCLIPLVIGLALPLVCFFWTPENPPLHFTRFDAKTFFQLFFSAAFGSAAMMLPGLDVSYMIHVFNAEELYRMLFYNHEIFFLFPIICGLMLGFIGVAWLVMTAYEEKPTMIYAGLFGLFIGSLPALFGSWNAIGNIAVALLFAAIGVFAARWAMGNLHIIPSEMIVIENEVHDIQYEFQQFPDAFAEENQMLPPAETEAELPPEEKE